MSPLLVNKKWRFLSKFTSDKIALNDTLIKIAKEEGLIPDQIDFLVQETNKQTWASLYKVNKDEAYDFPLADSSAVLSGTKDDFGTKTTKDYDVDYMSSPAKPSPTTSVEKVAHVEGKSKKELARELGQKLEKMAYARSDLHMKFLENSAMADGESEKIVKLLKNDLLEMPFSKRAGAFKKFASAVDQWINVSQIQHVLEKLQVMEKTAAHEAPEDLISRNTGATIINGNNEIIIRVKTLNQYNKAAQDAFSRMSLVDDTIPKVKEALREL